MHHSQHKFSIYQWADSVTRLRCLRNWANSKEVVRQSLSLCGVNPEDGAIQTPNVLCLGGTNTKFESAIQIHQSGSLREMLELVGTHSAHVLGKLNQTRWSSN